MKTKHWIMVFVGLALVLLAILLLRPKQSGLVGIYRDGRLIVTDEKADEKELRTLHKTIKKVSEDIENFSFNTSVSAFMICLNELGECNKREIIEPLTVLLAPFAPHIAEEFFFYVCETT